MTATDYKATLNLPQTDFPMKADLAKREPKIFAHWQQLQLYQLIRHQGQGRPIFVLHDGPPYANGPIHLGTAVNKTLKDIIVKAKTFSGFNVAFVPGWDCHGLPIELYVEKKIGKPGVKVSNKAFRDACRDFAASQVKLQSQAFQRLGILADWQHPYLTMDFKIEAGIVRALAKIISQGNLERGYRPVHWCLDCASSLAEAEVEYADKSSPAIDVLFKVVDLTDFIARIGAKLPKATVLTKVGIPIWTTTPWTIPANEAVAVNPVIDYALVATQKYGQLIIARSLLTVVMARYRLHEHQVLAIFPGSDLEYLLLQHPCYDRQVPVILGSHVSVDTGTGAVHTAPAHGYDDFLVGKQYNLPLNNPVAANGCFVPQTPLFADLPVLAANDAVISELRKQGNLLSQAITIHSYPHCWRHKTPVIFRATPQWFISLAQNDLRARAVAAISTVEWLPAWGEARITNMIAQRGDWCVSRQRTWGVPISLFVHKETGALHPQTLELMERVAQKMELLGIEAWYQLDLQELLGEDADN
jgi:isoleucyl-tRNA synthetase